ncbi:alginate lyase family protein [Mucilaginibacter sp. JRF]|uniref:alginate lyase family protein n=1 Tax=Mucilaginibacter sp. JRF TaxID=2780088 RepID=UPI00188237F3|nr:alginate lyase family protein [Mucilaginibacter sp. JRF]MBE9584042.1 alginate lyase family protein [Mucilaginibacter sp. JRF]
MNTTASLNFISNDANTAGSWREEMFDNTVDGYIERNINNITATYPDVVYVKASGSTPTENKMRTDPQLAYALALKWAKTQDSTYALQAITILNNWADNFKSIETVAGTFEQQRYLEAAWVIPTFAAAGEIIRWHGVNDTTASLWKPAAITKFEGFLRTMMTEYSDKIFAINYINNWYVSAAYAKMAVSVFINDVASYNTGYDLIKNIMPKIIDKDGTMREYCSRADCVHFQYTLTGFTMAADIDKIQSGSTELYEYGSLLRKGYGFMQKAYGGGVNGCDYCNPTKEVYPGIAVAYRAFSNNNLNYLTTLPQPAFGVNNDKTFLGFTMYTHYNVP